MRKFRRITDNKIFKWQEGDTESILNHLLCNEFEEIKEEQNIEKEIEEIEEIKKVRKPRTKKEK